MSVEQRWENEGEMGGEDVKDEFTKNSLYSLNMYLVRQVFNKKCLKSFLLKTAFVLST